MKIQLRKLFLALAVLAGGLAQLQAQSTAFTYQGRLNASGSPANGIYDLRFTIYDAPGGGNQVGGVLTNAATAVNNGLFTVTLDFGAGVFTGANRWLELGVRTNGAGTFAPLAPRQLLTAAPYALYAPNAGTAATAASVPAANVTGTATRHLGPTAQDFSAAFQVGTDEKHIAPIDEGGVALAAIQGLNQKLEGRLREKDAKIGILERRLAELEKLVTSLAQKGVNQ